MSENELICFAGIEHSTKWRFENTPSRERHYCPESVSLPAPWSASPVLSVAGEVCGHTGNVLIGVSRSHSLFLPTVRVLHKGALTRHETQRRCQDELSQFIGTTGTTERSRRKTLSTGTSPRHRKRPEPRATSLEHRSRLQGLGPADHLMFACRPRRPARRSPWSPRCFSMKSGLMITYRFARTSRAMTANSPAGSVCVQTTLLDLMEPNRKLLPL